MKARYLVAIRADPTVLVPQDEQALRDAGETDMADKVKLMLMMSAVVDEAAMSAKRIKYGLPLYDAQGTVDRILALPEDLLSREHVLHLRGVALMIKTYEQR